MQIVEPRFAPLQDYDVSAVQFFRQNDRKIELQRKQSGKKLDYAVYYGIISQDGIVFSVLQKKFPESTEKFPSFCKKSVPLSILALVSARHILVIREPWELSWRARQGRKLSVQGAHRGK